MVRSSLTTMGVVAIVAMVWANWPSEAINDGEEADLIVVKKAERVLELYTGDRLIRSYPASLGGSPVGPKHREGDERTPEGSYAIDYRKADSSFHRALHIWYPSSADMERARANGVNPGGRIMVHGLPKGFGFIGKLHRLVDWTDGCVAVTNGEIEQIWSVVRDGTPVRIEP